MDFDHVFSSTAPDMGGIHLSRMRMYFLFITEDCLEAQVQPSFGLQLDYVLYDYITL